MSRSRKHTPIEKSGSRMTKQQANKIVRLKLKDINFEIGDNRHYKSIVESYDIADYKCYCPNDIKIYRK